MSPENYAALVERVQSLNAICARQDDELRTMQRQLQQQAEIAQYLTQQIQSLRAETAGSGPTDADEAA